uniref:Uncharacterized protein n=1 Tax=Schistocephalus solidus TaxID=70667 RepID=A0A0X3NPE8_SCHSO
MAMNFPFRWIFFVITLLTLITLALIMVEMFTPFLYETPTRYTGIIYKCQTRPTALTFIRQVRSGCCRNQYAPDPQTVAAIMTLILVALFFVVSLGVWFRLYSATESWPSYGVCFAIISIFWMIFAIASQSILLAYAITSKPAADAYSSAFAALVAVLVLIFIIIVLLSLLVICKEPPKKVEAFFLGSSEKITFAPTFTKDLVDF